MQGAGARKSEKRTVGGERGISQDVDGISATRDGENGCIVEVLGEFDRIKCGRRDEELKVRTEPGDILQPGGQVGAGVAGDDD